jgi:hypothetical protein
MVTTQVAIAPVEAAEQISEVQPSEEQLAQETAGRLWRAIHRRVQTIYSNYMYQQGMLGLYGDAGEFDDP